MLDSATWLADETLLAEIMHDVAREKVRLGDHVCGHTLQALDLMVLDGRQRWTNTAMMSAAIGSIARLMESGRLLWWANIGEVVAYDYAPEWLRARDEGWVSEAESRAAARALFSVAECGAETGEA